MRAIKQAVIFKGSTELSDGSKDPYAEKIEALNIKCHVVPVLSFEFINENELKSRLDDSKKYTGIVFSSPRCVDSVKPFLQPEDWSNKDVYAVGEKTAASAVGLGLTHVKGQNTGNGLALADFILSEKSKHEGRRLLVPASDISRDALVKHLRENGVEVDQVAAYRTLPNPNLESLLTPLMIDQQVDFVLFFSPSGVDAVHPILTRHKTDNIKFGAIGSTTEDALKKKSLKVSFVAEAPNPDSVVRALKTIIQ